MPSDNPLILNLHRSDEEVAEAALRDEAALEWLHSRKLNTSISVQSSEPSKPSASCKDVCPQREVA